jgi:bacillithiol biosynthesis cysteine-adding enzyme BshC
MFAAQYIPYNKTNSFSKIVIDYLENKPQVQTFFSFTPDLHGIKNAIDQKKQQPIDRELLVNILTEQYQDINTSEATKQKIQSLLSANTFTVCTAHQPNLFTGPLYFLYKILHAIKLAESLQKEYPDLSFVPVYYMGSEDADFDELNHTYVDGKRFTWQTNQKGAVGRMKVDKNLLQLIDELQGQLGVAPFGKEVITLLRTIYTSGKTIQQATFELVNELFKGHGLIVLIPDNASLKAKMKDVFEEDILQNTPSQIVQKTSESLAEEYDVQAHPREINLFYLKGDIRERIEKKGDRFTVNNTSLNFSQDELIQELEDFPERFSPNVVLRGLFQETILPNIAFVGGGGELAYWLQLKDLFEHYKIVFPVLILRNSILIVEKKWQERIEKLDLSINDFFLSENEILNKLVAKNARNPISLNGNFEKTVDLFEQIKEQATAVDPSLSQHVAAIQARSLKTLQELEKKMLRAEKRKYTDQQRQIQTI